MKMEEDPRLENMVEAINHHRDKVEEIAQELQKNGLNQKQQEYIQRIGKNFDATCKRVNYGGNEPNALVDEDIEALKQTAVGFRNIVLLAYGKNIPTKLRDQFDRADKIVKNFNLPRANYASQIDDAVLQLTPYAGLLGLLEEVKEATTNDFKPEITVLYENMPVFADNEEINTLTGADELPNGLRLQVRYTNERLELDLKETFLKSRRTGRTPDSLGKIINNFYAKPTTQGYLNEIHDAIKEDLNE